ncbi:hypothetical protein DITRI_Ditri03aG0156000 [Diplodiscus trichospermus]
MHTTVSFPHNFLFQEHTELKSNKEIQQQKSATEMQNMNGVVITVYVESNSIVRPLSESIPNKKVKKIPVSKKAKRNQGYNRRAQLLAYSQELRNADHDDEEEQIQWNEKTSRHKSKASFFFFSIVPFI